MSSDRPYPVLFLRGLNTAGDDNLRFGRIKVGPMHRHWQRAIESHGRPFFAVTGRGGRGLAEQITRARDRILNDPIWRRHSRFHLLGHSAGGLVARALVHELGAPQRIASVVTIAAPHRGTWLAERVPELPNERPLVHWALRAFKYDIGEKLTAFADLTPQASEEFNQRYVDHPDVPYRSVVASPPATQLSWPFHVIHKLVPKLGQTSAHDGIVPLESQPWGSVLFRTNLDHLHQTGYDLSPWPRGRAHRREEFLRLVATLEASWRELETNG